MACHSLYRQAIAAIHTKRTNNKRKTTRKIKKRNEKKKEFAAVAPKGKNLHSGNVWQKACIRVA